MRATSFRRFTDLTITGLSPSVRLVVMAGPNGVGKSSVFDAFRTWSHYHAGVSGSNDESYYNKVGAPRKDIGQSVTVDFHEPMPAEPQARRKSFYLRSAYRNDPDFTSHRLDRVGDILEEARVPRLIDNDATVAINYRRLVAQTIEGVYSKQHDAKTVEQLREEFIGRVRSTMKRVFQDLVLEGPGDPLSTGSFFFEKGTSKGFHYKNLSGGEKAAFDLLLDLAVRLPAYDDTIFCIDEPETHLNTRLQATLLGELFTLIPANSQLWIATHSIGMFRKAKDLAEAHAGSVAFLDFEGLDFDKPVTLQPVAVNRGFWSRILGVALDDLAHLVAPKRIVLCEGRPKAAQHPAKAEFDARCYRQIFESEFPDTDFISVGNAADVWTDRLEVGAAIQAVVGGTSLVRLIDRDDRSPQEVSDAESKGIKVLARRHLESYLLDDEVLAALASAEGKPQLGANLIKAKEAALAASVQRGNPPDDVKSAAGETYNEIRRLLGLTGAGSSADAFLRDRLAPMLPSCPTTYAALRKDIFGV